MKEWIERGTEVNDVTTGRLINAAPSWQLFETSDQGSCLVVDQKLFDRWKRDYDLPEMLFSSLREYQAIVSAKNMMICSLSSGPYTKDIELIELVAIACKEAVSLYGESCLDDPLIVCDYGLVLPTGNDVNTFSLKAAFRTWLTGGIIVKDDMTDEEYYHLVPWLSRAEYLNIIDKAGIKTAPKTSLAQVQIKSPSEFNVPAEPFSLPGRRQLCSFLNENIVDVLRRFPEYKRMGFDFPGGTILYGPPGSGKTYAIDRLAEYLNFPRYDLTADNVASPYIHETSKKIATIFKEAKDNAPSILVIDEMEAFLSSRENIGGNIHHFEETAEFLRELPQLISAHVLIFGMTNLAEKLDVAIIRRGRFDYKIEIPPADEEDIIDVLKASLLTLPVENNIDYEWIAKKLAGLPLSDVSFTIREAGRISIKTNRQKITMDAFITAVGNLNNDKDQDKKPIGFSFD